MSFTIGYRPTVLLNQMIKANARGISIFAAAGNKNKDAGKGYPCAQVQAKCVAAVDNTYNKAKFSNYGSAVDFIAPGKDIISLGIKSDKALATKSGTSMACPHAVVAAAIFTSWNGLIYGNDLSQNFVWWNSIDSVVSGFKQTTDHFVTTGIHNPAKFPKEPFRWAGDFPSENQIFINASTSATSIRPMTQTPLTVPLSDMASSTHYAPSGFTMESGSPTFDPSIAGPKVTSSPSPVATCSGNQIEGLCTQAQLPSATPDSGILSPVCNKAGTGKYVMFNATQASDGVSSYCSELTSNKVVLSSSDSPPKPGYIDDSAADGGYVAMTVQFEVDACDKGTAAADQKLDFATWSNEDCYQYLYTYLASFCSKDYTWLDYNPDYSVEGGVYGSKCALWSLSGLSGSPPS